MSVKITYFVHSSTTDNESNINTGWNQGELSEIGIKQSKQLLEQSGLEKFDIVLCSDLKRAIDTAEIAFKGVYDIKFDKRLREVNYGELNGSEKKYFSEDLAAYINNPFPNGECFKDVERRMLNLIEDIKKNYDGKHVALVSHRFPQLALEVLLKSKTWEQAIEEDWRKSKKWRPGWKYIILN